MYWCFGWTSLGAVKYIINNFLICYVKHILNHCLRTSPLKWSLNHTQASKLDSLCVTILIITLDSLESYIEDIYKSDLYNKSDLSLVSNTKQNSVLPVLL